MARWSSTPKGGRRAPRAPEPLPPPLPPETRTVGQLVAESIKLYGNNFWRALPLGVPLAALEAVVYGSAVGTQTIALWALAPVFSAAFVWALLIVSGMELDRRAATAAFVVGVAVFLPFPPLAAVYLLPGLLYLGVFGLSVPAALLERREFRDALRRGFELGRADVVHAVGGLATLAIVFGVSAYALAFLLHGQGDQTVRVAATLGDLVLSPVIFLGSALLYVDQKARLELRAAQPERPSASHSRR